MFIVYESIIYYLGTAFTLESVDSSSRRRPRQGSGSATPSIFVDTPRSRLSTDRSFDTVDMNGPYNGSMPLNGPINHVSGGSMRTASSTWGTFRQQPMKFHMGHNQSTEDLVNLQNQIQNIQQGQTFYASSSGKRGSGTEKVETGGLLFFME